jgi:hypothetical protein
MCGANACLLLPQTPPSQSAAFNMGIFKF